MFVYFRFFCNFSYCISYCFYFFSFVVCLDVLFDIFGFELFQSPENGSSPTIDYDAKDHHELTYQQQDHVDESEVVENLTNNGRRYVGVDHRRHQRLRDQQMDERQSSGWPGSLSLTTLTPLTPLTPPPPPAPQTTAI